MANLWDLITGNSPRAAAQAGADSGASSGQQGGLFSALTNWWGDEATPYRLMALGESLQGADGQDPGNPGPYMQQVANVKQQQAFQKQIQDPELAKHFTPAELSFLAKQPREVALPLITERVFAKPEAPKYGFQQLADGTLVRTSSDGSITPMGSYAKPDPGYTMLSPDEAKALGLPDGAYQRSADGKVSQIGGSGVTVNVGDGAPGLGKLSPDYGYVLDPATGQPVIDPSTGLPTAAPVPGSPASTAAAKVSDQDAARRQAQETTGDVITNAAKRALDAGRGRMLGGVGQSVAGMLPWTDSAEVQRQVDVLKANATIETLNAMRQQSPTGGALGSVTEGENRMLAAKAGALDPSSPNFERDLLDYSRTLLQTIHGREAGDRIFNEQFGAQDQSASGAGVATVDSKSAYDALPSGSVFIGPDGKQRRKP
ncbi:hypothetical protein D2T29_10755 [Sinirhodobacter populi]|uniref:Uncharacterized protein n=1 Tax=Paenirhodobacter populi TaxID=2306993 RepID=A0A443KFH4_9RHOB|nr:hypothetical protein [Sinirhodobacter populi]RWR31504.1 hypothetical protein D2T29_10755 [Sinirhodobacter populi]